MRLCCNRYVSGVNFVNPKSPTKNHADLNGQNSMSVRVVPPSGREEIIHLESSAQCIGDLKAEYADSCGVTPSRQHFYLPSNSSKHPSVMLPNEYPLEQLRRQGGPYSDPDAPEATVFVEYDLDGGCQIDCKCCAWVDCTCCVCEDCCCQSWLGCVPVVICCGARFCCPGVFSCCCTKGCTLDCICCKDTCCKAVDLD